MTIAKALRTPNGYLGYLCKRLQATVMIKDWDQTSRTHTAVLQSSLECEGVLVEIQRLEREDIWRPTIRGEYMHVNIIPEEEREEMAEVLRVVSAAWDL